MNLKCQHTNHEFVYSYTDEPHATRRKLILQKYPQIKKLMGVDPAFKWQVIALVIVQIISFYVLKDVTNFWTLLPIAYCFGGVANHALMLAIHEISHNMAYGPARPLANRLFGMFANLPIGVPLSVSFRRYHLDHHRYQGDEILDVDIPTFLEAALFTSPIRKTIWCLLQPFFYFIRPLFIQPKPLTRLEALNTIVQITFDALIVYWLGWHILIYMIGGSILAMGLHPVAGHFISEHTLMFEFKSEKHSNSKITSKDMNLELNNNFNKKEGDNQKLLATVDQDDGSFLIPETCSYYGPLNMLTFNVGYHVEHHDFPSIPGSRLHKLMEIAPEFYSNLNHHTSWTYVIWKYITDAKVGPSARVRRPHRNLVKIQL